MRRHFWFLGLLASVFVAGCGSDISGGNQLAGQRCYQSTDCAPGLTCYERACVPSGSASNPNNQNNANNQNNQNNVSDMGSDASQDLTADLPDNCGPGDRVCLDSVTRAVCIVSEAGTGEWAVGACPPNSRCRQGQCEMEIPECIDRDGDGFGAGCPPGPDCNDGDSSVNPMAAERCETPIDDNCDGFINEGCEMQCCPNGCNDNEFCNADCVCLEFDPQFCEYQDQPCLFEQQFANGYICAEFGDAGGLRCLGLCDNTAPDPSATCPSPGAVCTFGDEMNGVCLSECSTATGCGQPGLGCFPFGESGRDGICAPANPNMPLGSPCDPDDGFFVCEAGAVCVQAGPGGGRCRQACRPFIGSDGLSTDCNMGTHCLPVSAAIGICFEDNDDVEGGRCFPGGTACQQDAVGCYPSFQQGMTRCQRLCRLDLGNADCQQLMESCVQFDQQQTEIGVCAGNP